MIIAKIESGWNWLEQTLNRIIGAVNANQPLGSASIAIEQSPNGTVLKVVKSQDQQPPQGGGGGGGGTAVQAKGPYNIQLNGVAWLNVITVDPVSCAKTTITVLVRQTGSSVTFNGVLSPQ